MDPDKIVKLITRNSMIDQIDRDIRRLLSNDQFATDKSNALSAGGPIDKRELHIANFDIAAAFAKAVQQNE